MTVERAGIALAAKASPKILEKNNMMLKKIIRYLTVSYEAGFYPTAVNFFFN
jgi:hypothetical protein